jgi:hypothetical protein
MAGTYQEGQSQVLSGVYTLIKAAVQAVAIGDRGVIAYPFTADWGPVNQLDTVITQAEFDQKYHAQGSSFTAAKIYKFAWKGTRKPQRVRPYRMATSSAAKGTATLNDSTGAKSLELETLYPSARPFVVKVSDGLTGGKVIEIIENSVLLEKIEGTSLEDLEAKLNMSATVRVKSKGTQLPANTNGVNFTGGDNGSDVTTTEYQAFLTELEADGYANAFALDGVSDDALLEVARAWTKRVRSEGFYISFVQGGPASWDSNIIQAFDKSKSINYRGIVNVGNGYNGDTASDLAIMVAAMVGSVPLNRTLTDERLEYGTVNNKSQLVKGNRVKAKESGTLIFVQDGDYVMIDEGVNTLTNPTDENEKKEMGKIRVSNALDQIAKDLEAFGQEYKKTLSNTAEARIAYAAMVERTYLAAMQRLEVIQPGYFYKQDPDYHGKNAPFKPKIDEAFFWCDITPVDSMERIYQKIGVNF